MKTVKMIEMYLNKIEAIRYENENGGAYAYIQYLAYSRELLIMLRPLKKVERQLEAIEGINWLFNEHLAFKFSPRHKIIFEEKMAQTKELFGYIRHCMKNVDARNFSETALQHAQAA